MEKSSRRRPSEEQMMLKTMKKKHPRWPVSTRIGIVGGGPSGLSAAYALVNLGYRNVTILEKHHSVGGMCESVTIEGKVYDLGGQVLAANSAPVIFHLAKEIGCELEEMDSHTFATIDTSTGQHKDMEMVDDYLSVISLTLKLQDEAKDTGLLGVHAMSTIAAEPTPEFLKRHGFKTVPKSVAYGFTASGYGFVEDMPYAYVHEFTRTSMAGKTRRFKGGYMSFWQKMSQSLPIEVHCNAKVLAIRRRSDEVSVEIRNSSGETQVMEFDKIIISGSFPFRNGKTYRSPSSDAADMVQNNLLDVTETERELFGKVKAIDYYTTVLKIKGLEHLPMGFYYFDQFINDPATIGHPVAMQRFYSDTNIFLFWSYGNSVDIKEQKVLEMAIKDVESMGGEVERVILQRRFKYFPHVSSEDMKNHFYDKLEKELQGQNNTYYVGGLMAFELTERNSAYSMALVQKHFASETSSPALPYVKRLFPMQSDSNSLVSRQLDELSGVEFPDLCTLDGYLKHWGTHNVTANKTLYTWINDRGETVACRTFSELHTNASRLAHKLLTTPKPLIKPGDRVLLVYLPGLDFIDAFFGCLRARVVPVPTLPPDPSQKHGGQALLHIQNIAKSCNAVAILSTFGFHASVQAGAVKNMILSMGINGKNSLDWPALPWIHTDSWIKSSKVPENSTTNEPLRGDLCFLQYTSGSTGDAKGVMITHGGLIHNIKMMRRRYKSTSKTVLVSWLPQYHDMGLIGGFFTTLVSGGTAILFSPLTFIQRPLLWLHTMSKYKATHSAGPNFAFELVVRRLESNKDKMEINLSSMAFLMIAAEPVRAETLKRFIELTHPFGLSQEIIAPGYGLAENCVFVSCAFGEGKPIFVDWQQRVCCGYIYKNDQDVDIKIVDPGSGEEKQNCEDEGEIWISSMSSGAGYWGKEELSQETFNNELKNHQGKKYIRTGDLGRIIDGKLFITGRMKDLIIVGGRNVYSSDIEKTVENSSELLRPGCCAVIGVPEEVLSAKGIRNPNISDEFGLVVVAEVREGKRVTADIGKKIQVHVAEEHGVILASIVLIKPRTISKTTSGKIKRYECLRQFTEGTLQLVADSVVKDIPMIEPPLSTPSQTRKSAEPEEKTQVKNIGKNEIVEFLKSLLSEQTGISTEEISITEGLMSYGIDSIGVVRAAQKLSDFLGVPVGAIDIFSATCIDDLANFAESLLAKSRPQLSIHPSAPPKNLVSGIPLRDVSPSHKYAIYIFQLLALIFVATFLTVPAYFSIYSLTNLISSRHIILGTNPWLGYLTYLVCAPLAWLLCIASTCILIGLGKPFLQPNYALNSHVSMWSIDFVKWWALYKVQELSSKVLAVHLRGTVFLNYWFTMFGARVGSSVLLDTVDITDPYMVEIGDGAVIAEGALIQCHEVKRGILSFCPTRIGQNSSVGPYAVVQKGSVVDEGSEVEALQTTEEGNIKNKRAKEHSIKKEKVKLEILNRNEEECNALYHFMGIYIVGFLSTLSAAMVYIIYTWISQTSPSIQHFGFVCICGTFHWFPYILIAYATMFSSAPTSFMTFAAAVAIAYLSHGFILTILTSILSYCLGQKQHIKQVWLRHQLIVSCHVKFAKLLSGTEAFCTYLRLFGATIGRNCSIRAINPILNPELITIGAGVHLGDFSRIITGFYSSKGFIRGNIEVRDNSVTGSQSLILPGSVIQEDVILGALSIAPLGSTLYRGGVFVGSHTPVMVKNTLVDSDERIDEMDFKYKKILGGLAASLASTTLKVRSRYFHRIGAAGKGSLRIYDHIPGFPDHKIIKTGKRYPVIIRHSNCLSSDDDARKDPRGAAIRILSDEHGEESPLLDLTLKTGRAFHARTIADFATWLVCGVAAREEHVKRAPHIREAMWDSLRQTNSYAELHYYSNICRLFRFKDGQERYVKFKLRPLDETIGEESGKVEPDGILPPETGAIPRDKNDSRPLLFLEKDFRDRLNSPSGVHYVLQLQVRPVPDSEEGRDDALDCTKPWAETEFPYVDVGEMTIDQDITKEESDQLEFNPYLRCHEVDVIRAFSCTQSASMDHGRSVVYAICQHLRNKKPLPEAWRVFLDQSDVKVDITGCPMAAALAPKDTKKVTLARTWCQDLWATSAQPLLQVTVPYFLMGLVTFAPLTCLIHLKEKKELQLQWLLPLLWIFSGVLMATSCAIAKWVLVGKKEDGESMMIWSRGIFMDTIWQAVRTVAGEYFVQMTTGSALFGIWMNLMGSNICWHQGAYIDSMEAAVNPEMVAAKDGASVERDALLFGHIYEGEGGKVKYGKVTIGEGGFIGSRAVTMPGVIVEKEGNLGALSLAMKEEIVRSR